MVTPFPKSAWLLWCAGLGATVIAAAGCRHASSEPAQSVSIPKTCPYGHTTVRRAEVVYGLMPTSPAGEVVAGGCVVEEGVSPAYLFVCKTCDFRQNPVTEDWVRETENPHRFDRPLSSPILSFPVAVKPQLQGVRYTQHFQDGVMTTESVDYWTSEKRDVILARLTTFAAKYGVELNSPDSDSSDRAPIDHELSIHGVPAELSVWWMLSGEAHVSFRYLAVSYPDLRNPSATVPVSK
jgi:hypothetical protein